MDEPKPGARIMWPELPRFVAGRHFASIASVIVCLIGTACAEETAPRLTPTQIAQIATSCVVLIRTPTGLGSGFGDWPAKAWALRDSFDGLMNAIAAHSGAANR